jgi:hypothetical protein
MLTPAALAAFAKGDMDNFAVAATPGGIEAQEAAGQAKLVSNFTRLPKNMGPDGRKIAEALGFVFGEAVDEVFVAVTPPAGWSLKATEHSMHSDVLDASGEKRAGMFYKAAFYDRRADLYWLARYQTRSDWDRFQDNPPPAEQRKVRVSVWDNKTNSAVWSEEIPDVGEYGETSEQTEPLKARAMAYLKEHFPAHADVTSYW